MKQAKKYPRWAGYLEVRALKSPRAAGLMIGLPAL